MSEEKELLERIAAVSGMINLQKQNVPPSPGQSNWARSSAANSYWTPQRGTPYGTSRGARGGRHATTGHRNRTLVLSNAPAPLRGGGGGGGDTSNSSGRSTPTAATPKSGNFLTDEPTTPGWVSKRDRHYQLINNNVFEKQMQERQKAMEETAQKKQLQRNQRERDRLIHHFQGTSLQSSAAVGQDHLVRINDLDFRVTDGGNKLVRVSVLPETIALTPKETSIAGVKFRRSKHGNLYRSSHLKTKGVHLRQVSQKKNELCPKFTLTGTCFNGPRCRYIHDPDKVAICREFLQSGSCVQGEACDLSHHSTPHRVPACTYFMRGNCTNDNCRYAHVHVDLAAPVCRALVLVGYCEAGGACPKRHVFECPDYSDTGDCRNEKCRLPHIDSAQRMRRVAATAASRGSGEGSNEDADDDMASDLSSDHDLDDIGSEDVDSDEVDEFLVKGTRTPGEIDDQHLSQQADFIPFD